MKDYEFNLLSIETPPNVPPEHILWLAVIDRALVDYVRWYQELNIKQKRSLNWFLFEEDSCPNNLQYLCELLFDDHEAADTIRKRARYLANHATEGDIIGYNLTRCRRVKNRLT
jgi:hypothetical protein